MTRFLDTPHHMLIGGQWAPSRSASVRTVHNPATGEPLAEVAEAGAVDVDAAVAAARRTFDSPDWRRMPPARRTELLWNLSYLIEEHAEELAVMEVLNQGKPLPVARGLDVKAPVQTLRYYAGWATKIEGTTVDLAPVEPAGRPYGPHTHAYSLREPVGVAAAIVPWNVPLLMAVARLAPAITAGCTVIIKPAEQTPLTTLRLGELIEQAGFPPGAVNIVTGSGEVAGAALVSHPDVDKIAFVGSTETARTIAASASRSLKRLSLECGGKSPTIVFADADVEEATAAAAGLIFLNSGQMCFAGSRLLVHSDVADDIIAGVVDHARSLKVGPGMDLDTDLGPLVSQEQLDRVSGYLALGRSEGATLVTGGSRIDRPGYFVEPTVFRTDDPALRVNQEEIFGPVLVTTEFSDESEVIAMANATSYGLSASVWTNDLSRAHVVASELRVGGVSINCAIGLDHALPMGLYKQSGIGVSGGFQGVEEYLETKSVTVALR
ncbi:MAG: aldehyde dehydrogenase family protein [Gemmatimonadetes bacterium]|nr:aldehyde dehydrogenase family protein [Gemmatimonadota bacterium]